MFIHWYPIFASFLSGIICYGLLASRKNIKLAPPGEYISYQFLLSANECCLFHKLQQAIDQKSMFISCQVRMIDIIKPDPRLTSRAFFQARASIFQKHLDFVICRTDNSRIICAIELDDASHQRPERQKSDQLKNKAFKQAQIPLIRYMYPKRITIDQIKKDILIAYAQEKKKRLHMPACPQCGGLLLTNTIKELKIKKYCSSFPRCRYQT